MLPDISKQSKTRISGLYIRHTKPPRSFAVISRYFFRHDHKPAVLGGVFAGGEGNEPVAVLSGLPVDEYAVTDKNGVAKFENVLISGDTPYVVEEVDTAIRYVVPESQTAPIEWEKVTSRSFTNILKKFNVTVTKSDAETGTAQGDASLAGAVYGIYKGKELIDIYTTDENGQFTTKYYVCGNDWTVREIIPSEGYLLDTTIHKVGAEPELYPEVTTIDTFYTTADGDLITPQTLEYGTGYSIVEVQAPYGYVLNSEPVRLCVTDGIAAGDCNRR